MQSGWILIWLLTGISCIQMKQPRSQTVFLNNTPVAVQSPLRPRMQFDLLMLQIDRVSMLYPDGEVTRMLNRIAYSVQYEVYNDQILRIPADCHLKAIYLESAPRLRTILVSGTNNALETLHVINSAIRRIPISLQHLQRLQALYVNHGILETFSLEPFIGIPNLTHVYVTQNKVRRLEVSKDSTLAVTIYLLVLSNNRLEFIDMEFFAPLKQLGILDLSENTLKNIDARIPILLPSLMHIHLGYNKLKQMSFANWIAPKLTQCHLRHNNFTQLPLGISRLINLEVIVLSFNQLMTLDLKQLENFHQLRFLHVANNRLLSVLPDCQSQNKLVCQRVSMPALEHIDLGGNMLTTIDFSLWDMPTIRTIVLSNNQLQRLSNDLNMFPKLNELKIYNNYLSCLDIHSLEAYIETKIIKIYTKADNLACPTKSSIIHPYEKGVICCND